MVICLERGANDSYSSADATATPSCLVPAKSRMVYLFGAGLPRLSWKKPLNGCSSVVAVSKLNVEERQLSAKLMPS